MQLRGTSPGENAAGGLGEGGGWREISGFPSCVHSRLGYFLLRAIHNLLFELTPIRPNSNVKGMLPTSNAISLLVNHEKVTVKPRAGGRCKDCAPQKATTSYLTPQ